MWRDPIGQSRSHYTQSVQRARIRDLWRRFTGERADLAKLDDVARQVHARPTPVQRLEYVPLTQIVGSAGRPKDFTRDFLPRSAVELERWVRVDAAINAGVDLPLVDLYRLGDVYFVNDGHHRISAAHVNGFKGIEASVTVMDSPVWLTEADFHHDEWRDKTELRAQAESSAEAVVVDADTEPAHIAGMVWEFEDEPPAYVAMRGQASLQERLRMRVGDALIELDNRVKTPALPPTLLSEYEQQCG